MDKWLVFRLEKPFGVDKLGHCFELVKEFDVTGVKGIPSEMVKHWAYQYSKDNGLRTLVIKGSVFGGD